VGHGGVQLRAGNGSWENLELRKGENATVSMDACRPKPPTPPAAAKPLVKAPGWAKSEEE